MPAIRSRLLLVLIVCAANILLSAMTHADGVRGWFGVKLDVDTTGFSLNPTLRSVTISKVIAGSPAASQGLASGDQVQEVEGLTVPGRKAREVQAVMHRSVGETLHLRLKRVNGDVYSVALTAVARP